MRGFFFITLLCSWQLSAQNLVINGSFEDYHDQQYDGKLPWADVWRPNFLTSPDFYYRDSVTSYSYPFKGYNFIEPKDGNAFMGMIILSIEDGQAEHLVGELKEPLKKGRLYNVSFYVRHPGKTAPFFVTRMGVRFSGLHKSAFIGYGIHYQEIIDSSVNYDVCNDTALLNDTTWQRIEGLYRAKGKEQEITIGIFYESQIDSKAFDDCILIRSSGKTRQKKEALLRELESRQMGYLKINKNYDYTNKIQGAARAAYYFIDDVEVSEVIE
jgi:hypothetical protein